MALGEGGNKREPKAGVHGNVFFANRRATMLLEIWPWYVGREACELKSHRTVGRHRSRLEAFLLFLNKVKGKGCAMMMWEAEV